MAKTILETFGRDKLEGKKVFLRLDLNVPINAGVVTDDSRIQAAIPTINYLRENGAKVIIASHLGRPKGQVVEELRLNVVAAKLSEILGVEVKKIDEAVGDVAKDAVAALGNGEVLLLENIRFYPGEEKNDPDFAKQLAELADLYVNDAFGTAHRAHASTVGVASYLSPAIPGFLMEKEIEMLGAKLERPERPFTAIIGGSKISSKISVLKELLNKVDVLLIGGGMAYTFIKAQGGSIGRSICEDDHLETAREILQMADQKGSAIILPADAFCSAENIFEVHGREDKIATQVYKANAIPDNFEGLDIGPETIQQFVKIVGQSRTIVWNGPLGVFEYDSFEQGTKAVARALKALTADGGTTIIGGGDSVAAIEKFGFSKSDFTHVSTGGGASLEFLEGKTLPGVACLDLNTKLAS